MKRHRLFSALQIGAAACGLAAAARGDAYQNYLNSSEYQSFRSFRTWEEKRYTLAYLDRAIFEARRSNDIFRDPQAAATIREMEAQRARAANMPVDANGGGTGAAPGTGPGANAPGANAPGANARADYEEQARAALNAHMERAKQELQEQMEKDRKYYQEKTQEGVRALDRAGADALSDLDALDRAEERAPAAKAPRAPSQDEQLVDVFADSAADVLGSLVSDDDLTHAADPGPSLPPVSESAALEADAASPENFDPIDKDSLLPPTADSGEGGAGEANNYGGFGPEGEKPQGEQPPAAPAGETAGDSVSGSGKDAAANAAASAGETPGGEGAAGAMKSETAGAASSEAPGAGPGETAGTAPSETAGTEGGQAPVRDFKSLAPAEQTEINRKTDELWAEKNGLPPGTKIDPQANPEAAKEWLAQRQEVMASSSSGPPSAAATVVPTTPGAAAPVTAGAGESPSPGSAQSTSGAEAPMAQDNRAQPEVTAAAATPAESGSANPGPSAPAPAPGAQPGEPSPGNAETSREPTIAGLTAATANPGNGAAAQKMSGELGISNSAGPVQTKGSVSMKGDTESQSFGMNAITPTGKTVAGGSVKTSENPNGETGFEAKAKVPGFEVTYGEQRGPGGKSASTGEVKVSTGPLSVAVGGGSTLAGGNQASAAVALEGSVGKTDTGKVTGSIELKAGMTSVPVSANNDPLGSLMPGTNKTVNLTYGAKTEITGTVGNRSGKASFSIQDDVVLNRGLYSAHSADTLEFNGAQDDYQFRSGDPVFLGQVARMAEIEKANWARTNDPRALERARWYVQTRNSMEASQRGTPAYNQYMRQRCIENARLLESDPKFHYDYRKQEQAQELRHQALLYQKLLQP